jgi:predicted DNA-binding transcriptional regulator AlpA
MMEQDKMPLHAPARVADEPDERQPNGRLIPATTLSKDMGFTRRTLGRKLHEDPEFPKPVRMGGRLYWFEGDIEAYKRLLIQRSLATPVPVRRPEMSPRLQTVATIKWSVVVR